MTRALAVLALAVLALAVGCAVTYRRELTIEWYREGPDGGCSPEGGAAPPGAASAESSHGTFTRTPGIGGVDGGSVGSLGD